nr:MBL fold metallo-hydrolase [Endobacterium cereale]
MNGDWGACNPDNPKNRRTRASMLVEQIGPDGGRTTVVIDTGPDFRAQMIAAKVENLDAVLYTHAHADHFHGLDDLRGYFLVRHHRVPIHVDIETLERIREGFGYCLETPSGSSYPPIAVARMIEPPYGEIVIDGAGGPISFMPHRQVHGDIHSLGFRIGDVAYCSDVSDFPAESVDKLSGLDMLIIDALQYKPHPSHLSLGQALEWIERLTPRRAILTHMHTPLDYDAVMSATPDNVVPAHDGLSFEIELDIVG